MKYFTILFTFIYLASCTTKKEQIIDGFNVEDIYTFSEPGVKFGEPYLYTSPSEKVYLSWIEQKDGLSKLMFSELIDGFWAPPRLIASGTHWFVNWADYPQMAVFKDGTFVAFFLEKSGEGTFSYDIKITFSKDGSDWSDPRILHDDGTRTEHGFGSMVPWGDHMLITWLDGRNTHSAGHDHGNHDHHAGQMNLRAGLLTSEGEKLEDWLLDDRVCDCCQTSATLFDGQPMVFFRDRSFEEVRDLGVIKYVDNSWEEAQSVYSDFWKVVGCPVNGPRSASFGKSTAVVWFTGVNEKPEVKVSFISSGDSVFSKPIKVDLGKTIGRVDIALLDEDTAMVSWMEQANIYARRVYRNGQLDDPILIASSSEKRSSGFPQLTVVGSDIILAWSVFTGDDAVIKTGRIRTN
ncbi:exo-alpha-sialidase [Belliella marina]|uniref:Exo-alpha-sialidase n=1 Tax=Belliella marina TaxID=1644146 RepID=A0ABW4VK30_9BACT